MKKLFSFSVLIAVLLGGIFLLLGYIAYLAFWPFQTIEFKNAPFPILNSQPVRAGEAVIYEVDLCRYTTAPTQINRTLVGPTTITILQDTSTSATGCRKTTVTNVAIPGYAPPGKYHLDISLCWQVNPLRTICKEIKTQEFEVIR